MYVMASTEDASKFASRKSSCAQPWWKTTDIDELAYLVSQKLLNHVENCDLPPPPRKIYLEAKENLDSGLIHRETEPSSNRGNFYISFDKSSRFFRLWCFTKRLRLTFSC